MRDAAPPARPAGRRRLPIRTHDRGRWQARSDSVATEEPLEIRLAGPPPAAAEPIALTMRTPGEPEDVELALGFLFGEGIVRGPADVRHASYCLDPDLEAEQRWNVVTVTLDEEAAARPRERLERHFFTSSACGVCGKARLDQLALDGCLPPAPGPRVGPDVLLGLPGRLREAQGLFERTGGLHAAGLFDAEGRLLALREDVGRHNAVDKLVGAALREGGLPLRDRIVMISGRASYEIMQKCLMAGAPIVCAVSAPSSLAVDVAAAFDTTLVGFLREGRFNVYHDAGRIDARAVVPSPEAEAR